MMPKLIYIMVVCPDDVGYTNHFDDQSISLMYVCIVVHVNCMFYMIGMQGTECRPLQGGMLYRAWCGMYGMEWHLLMQCACSCACLCTAHACVCV